ncbi:MAG: rubrerythrin family protein [Nitrospirae bacterium]|nr:rubrerythrin family protein [Nitrospirota bacterium]
MSSLEESLKEMFAAVSQANRKYSAFAKRAEDEGQKDVAKLLRAASEAEGIHANNFLRAMGMIKSTKENLNSAIDGEVKRFLKIYQSMMNTEMTEDDRWARMSLCYAHEAEKKFAHFFEKALLNLGQNKEADYFVCKICGFTVENELPEKCPVCGSRKKVFEKIE